MNKQSKMIKVLLIGDNPGDARLIQKMISEIDGATFDLERVDRLSDGLKHLSGKDVHVVLLDLNLPDSKGFDTFKKVYAKVPEVPIVIFTGLKDNKIAIECVRRGAQDYLVKGKVDGDLASRKLLYSIERKKARKALQESEGRYRSLINDVLDTSDVGIFILDAEFKVVWINHSTEKFFGLKREYVIGKDKRQLIRKRIKDIFEDPETFKQKVFATYDDNTYIENFECHVLPDKDREEYWLEHWSQPIRSGLFKNGRIEHYSNITSRKKAEESLLKSEIRFRELFNNMSSGVAVYKAKEDGKDFIFADFNHAGEKLDGIMREDLLGRSVLEIFPGVRDFGLFDVFQRVWNTGKSEHFPISFYKDERIVGWRENYVYKLPSGEIVAVYDDVTERMQAEESLRVSEAQKQALLDGSPDMIVRIDRNMKILWANKTVLDMNSDALGLTCHKAFAGLEEPCEDCPCKKAVDTGQIEMGVKYQPAVVGIEGESYWEDIGVPIKDIDGKVVGVIEIARNVTERKQAEKELAKYRNHLEELVKERTRDLEAAHEELIKSERLSVLGRLTATVSHDIRNPLGVIRSSSFYIQRKLGGAEDEKITKHLNRIEKQIDLCDTIVGDLLEYTRGRASEVIYGEINPLLEEVMKEITTTPEQVALVSELSPELPMIHFDKDKMRRVMINLVQNAFKAVTLRRDMWNDEEDLYQPFVKITSSQADNGIRIEVEDNGTGMDDETALHAFEPLFTTWARGTGLGLAIVKKIVEEHGGSVSLDSIADHGTKVIVRVKG